MLNRASTGFGALACTSLLADQFQARETSSREGETPTDPRGIGGAHLHHTAKAKRVIFCYMAGGASHIDTFDPKSKLKDLHGQPMPVSIERTQFNNNGNVMASPFGFTPSGQSGIEISDILPNIAREADELAVIRSMTSPVNEHAQGNYFFHTGFPFLGHPTAGAWCSYGLGSENENLPAFVVLQSGGATAPLGGVGIFSNGFLPGEHQASILKADANEAVPNIRSADQLSVQRERLKLAQEFDAGLLSRIGGDAEIEAAIKNYETAFHMQSAVPDLCDISGETAQTLKDYAVYSNDNEMAAYGRQCLMARRLVERGVRFIELSCLTRGIGAGNAGNPWDQHGSLEQGHRAMALQVDQPIGALIRDLRQRGLLEDTLVVWATEFGRTPFSQGSNGRDHNPQGFSVWLAGGGVKGGTVRGATDDLGYHAIEDITTGYDLWATVLHQLGIDHELLTYRHGGRDFRLTDVHGRVLHDILG